MEEVVYGFVETVIASFVDVRERLDIIAEASFTLTVSDLFGTSASSGILSIGQHSIQYRRRILGDCNDGFTVANAVSV